MKKMIYNVKSITENENRIKFVASTDSKDRSGEVIKQGSWDIKNYMKNPVLLYGHKSDELPIGKVTSINFSDNKIEAEAEFVSGDIYPFAGIVSKMYRDGFLNAFSVGYMPNREKQKVEENTLITDGQELFEISAVPVPCNSEALIIRNSIDRAFQENKINKIEHDLAESKIKEIKVKCEHCGSCKDKHKEDENKTDKAGRVLSKTNEELIKNAVNILKDVLSKLEKMPMMEDDEEEEDKTKSYISEYMTNAVTKPMAISGNAKSNITEINNMIKKIKGEN